VIITRTNSVKNNVYSTDLAVELNPLETAYVVAYGEPRVDLAGTINYHRVIDPTAQLPLNTETDIGTVPVAGSVVANAGLGDGAYEVTASGTLATGLTANPGFFKGNNEVVGDFRITMRLDDAYGYVDPAAVNGFVMGLVAMEDLNGDDPAVIFGWGGDHSATKILLWQRVATAGALAEIALAARANPRGLSFAMSRIGNLITGQYSVDNGANWITLGTATVTKQALMVGVLFSSGELTAASVVITGLKLVNSGVVPTDTFTIGGGPSLAYVRSQSPHHFQLDKNIDVEAKEKVAGWGDTITGRIQSAISTLLLNENPTVANTQTMG
jgi:hypothetical protein